MDIVRLRYVGVDRVRVPKLGRVVEPDELVGVPADVYKQYGWPESQWMWDDGPQSLAPGAADQQVPGSAEQQQSAAAGDGVTTTTTSRKGKNDA